MTTIHGINVVKLVALISILVLHANEFIFYTDIHPIPSVIYNAFLLFARCNVISGQVLVFLIYFLFGLKSKNNHSLLKISLFALLGQLVLTLIFMSEGQKFEWDIYLFIAASNLLLILMTSIRGSLVFLIFSFLILWIPTGFFIFPQPEIWPLVPWFFLASFAFAAGGLVNKNYISLEKFKTWEWGLWIFCTILSLPFLGAYFHTPIGPNYYRFALYQKPWVFWANFWPYLFLLRLSFLKPIQTRLESLSLIRAMSRLHWCRFMGQLYLMSVILLGLAATQSDFFMQHPLWFDVFFVSVMPLCELISRGIRRIRWNKLPDKNA